MELEENTWSTESERERDTRTQIETKGEGQTDSENESRQIIQLNTWRDCDMYVNK